MLRNLMIVAAVVFTAVFPTSARAAFHLWRINEIYSNSDGSVQFVEFFTNSGSQEFVGGQQVKTSTAPAHTFTFPANLGPNTANKSFLIATPGFAALPGAVTPDYTFASANFFSRVSDTINFVGAHQLSFTAGQLPTDGVMSFNRNFTTGAISQAVNSPKNYAGQVGSLLLPIPGDFDGDRDVDRADAARLAANFGITAGATRSQGDANADGSIGLADLAIVQSRLVAPGSPTASPAAIPEPAAWILALVGALCITGARRRWNAARKELKN